MIGLQLLPKLREPLWSFCLYNGTVLTNVIVAAFYERRLS